MPRTRDAKIVRAPRLQQVAHARRWACALATTACLAGAAASTLFLSACQDPLLAANESRSPFDRYDAVRNQHAPQFVEDQYGRRQPNLRGRLQPKE